MKRVTIEIETNERVYELLERLAATGLYGMSVEDAAERLICRGLEDNSSAYEYNDHQQEVCSASPDGKHFRGCGCP